MKHFKFFAFVFLTSLVMALLEVQIEGGNGWAANLPTWRLNLSTPLFGILGKAEKPLTGYHTYLWLYSILLCHLPLLFVKWNKSVEFKIISFYILMSTLEGILWFVVNPSWGFNKFNSTISWYNEIWILGLPIEYYLRFGVGFIFYFLSEKTNDN